MSKRNDNEYNDLLYLIKEIGIGNKPDVRSEAELKSPSQQSSAQADRDQQISRLLIEYVSSYEKKNRSCKSIRKTLIIFSLACVVIFALASIVSLIFYLCQKGNDWQGLAAVISAFLTCAGLLIGVLKIITKYAFPNDSEENITEIVKAIQQNDLKNRFYDLQFDSIIKGYNSKLTDMEIEKMQE